MTKSIINKILKALDGLYPIVETQLYHKNPFELLIATILSAQCTDRQVNQVTPRLFSCLPAPEDFADASLSEIESLIHSVGFYHSKAKNIQRCCEMLLQKYGGNVPSSLEQLLELPGVGRKTANVVLGYAFGIPGIVVDTHVKRITQRLGLTRNKTPEKIEYDLMECIPKNAWSKFSLQLVYFGREFCIARKPKCAECALNKWCDYANGA